MGATLWYHAAPWFPNAEDALFALQSQFLAEHYDFAAFVRQQLQDTRDAVRQNEEEGDPYELREMYRDKLALLEGLMAQTLPDDFRQRIDLMRKLHMDTGEGIGNVLDVEAVSAQRRHERAQVLPASEIARFTGNTRPTLAEAEKAVSTINEELSRGECVCFPVYADEKPVGWYFVGNTAD